MSAPTKIERPFWRARLEKAWQAAPIVWLSGVRRVGKTTLAQQLPEAKILNCDLPSTARQLEDPERFFASAPSTLLVFDEIHQLPDPSRLLKIAADEHPHLKILATGSSTLAATEKFKDSLAGRKRVVHLLPVLAHELPAFGVKSLERRLFHGGLPQALLAERKDPELYGEWLDSYFARDVQELFRVGKRTEFLKLLELLLRQSSGALEATSLAKHCGLSRPTVMTYLDVLEVTQVLFRLRPFHGGGRQEVLAQPKAYGFDTGFVSFAWGYNELRPFDWGKLWEHLVLETLRCEVGDRDLFFWRTRDGREVDFVLPGRRGRVDTIECKWTSEGFSIKNLRAFRDLHPHGFNYVLSPQTGGSYSREQSGLVVVFANLEQWESGEAERIAVLASRP